METLLKIGIILYFQLKWLVCWPFMKRTRYTTTAGKINRIPNMGYGCGEIVKLLNRDYGSEMEIYVTGKPRFRYDRYTWTFHYVDTRLIVTE
ncbi:hypothetical protein D3C81_379270 [compost metagenome]